LATSTHPTASGAVQAVVERRGLDDRERRAVVERVGDGARVGDRGGDHGRDVDASLDAVAARVPRATTHATVCASAPERDGGEQRAGDDHAGARPPGTTRLRHRRRG